MNSLNNNNHTVLKIYCNRTNTDWLIDTGSCISVSPVKIIDETKRDRTVYAANQTEIRCYGTQELTLDLGLNKLLKFEFVLADIDINIIGSDFLAEHGLCVDIKNKTIFDNENRISSVLAHHSYINNIRPVKNPEIWSLIEKYPSLTKKEPYYPGLKINYLAKFIPKPDAKPQACRPRKLSPHMKIILEEMINDLIDRNLLVPASSEWASAVHLVPKGDPAEKKFRMTGDYARVNSQLESHVYPIPYLTDAVNLLHNKKYFSVIDITDAFFSVPLHMDSRKYTAITTPIGLYQFTVIPQGFKQSAGIWQSFIDDIFRNISYEDPMTKISHKPAIYIYLDDLILASATKKEALYELEAIFKILAAYNLKIAPAKCKFLEEKVKFLGYEISSEGYVPAEDKTIAISKLTLPATLGSLKQAIGQMTFFHKFIEKASEILSPLYELLHGYKKNQKLQKINWGDNKLAKDAFENAKTALINRTVLAFPNLESELILQTDASSSGVGACLKQIQGSKQVPLGFFSKKLQKPDSQLSAYSRELYAVFLATKYFEHMVTGVKVIVETDSMSLIQTFKRKNVCDRSLARETRWLIYICQFDFSFRFIEGKNNHIADLLSRNIYAIADDRHTAIVTSTLRESLITEQNNCTEIGRYKIPTDECIKLQKISGIFCQFIKGRYRPFVPKNLRYDVISRLHNMNHLGCTKTVNLVSERFVWPHLKSDVKNFVKSCEACQTCKITQHNHTSISNFSIRFPERFSVLNIDSLGPLILDQGYRHILVLIDRFTYYTMIIPVTDIQAATLARAIMSHWLTKFGSPQQIICDRSQSFLGHAFSKMLEIMGVTLTPITAFSPWKNGFCERINRGLKVALRASGPYSWFESALTYNLAINATFRDELGCSPNDMVFGSNIRLPVDLLDDKPLQNFLEPHSLPDRVRRALIQTIPKPRIQNQPAKINPTLYKCEFVYVRNMAKKGLQAFYTGPYKILARGEKNFDLQINNKSKAVSINHLKSAHLYNDLVEDEKDEPCIPALPDDTFITDISTNTSTQGTIGIQTTHTETGIDEGLNITTTTEDIPQATVGTNSPEITTQAADIIPETEVRKSSRHRKAPTRYGFT